MIQMFFKKSKITAADWLLAYQRIESIVNNFPLKLIRVAAHDGWSKEFDTLHFDLYVNKGKPDEYICFFSDWITLIPGVNAKFYKQWNYFVNERLEGDTKNENKPITWYPATKFEDDGSHLEANGAVYQQSYLDVEGVPYEFAILAIGIMLENLLPDKVLLTAYGHANEPIEKTVEWLTVHFSEDFEMPIYFDKQRLLASFINEYADKKEAACRMEHLFRKQYKRNIEFAIDNVGYEPTFTFYAEVLAIHNFGTFGFADVLDAWVSATKDLESALALIAESKRLLLLDTENIRNQKRADEYDLAKTLKSFLNEYILWTPEERELINLFYTNKEALEKGEEDLWGSIMRMTGKRINVCPMHATQDELFEAFMYHDPKNGLVYKNIIDNWVKEHTNDHTYFKQKLSEAENKFHENSAENATANVEETSQNIETQIAIAKNYIQQFSTTEQYFVETAIRINPYFTQLEDLVIKTRAKLESLRKNEKHKDLIDEINVESRDEKIFFIRYRIKQLRMSLSVNPNFQQWLEDEKDENVLFNIRLLVALKFYNLFETYARFRILWNKDYWNYWRVQNKNP